MATRGPSEKPRARFNYARFSEEARQAVVTAADLALSAGAERVLPEHLAAAANGAQRTDRATRELGFIAFAEETMGFLRRIFYTAEETATPVEVTHLRTALQAPNRAPYRTRPAAKHRRPRGA